MRQKTLNRQLKLVIRILIIVFCTLFLFHSTAASHAVAYTVDEKELITEPYDQNLVKTMAWLIAPGVKPSLSRVFRLIGEYYSAFVSPIHKMSDNTDNRSFDLLLNEGMITEYRICTFEDGSRVVLLLKNNDQKEEFNREIQEKCYEYVQRYSKPYLIKESKEGFIIYDSDNISEMIAPDKYIYMLVEVGEYKIYKTREENRRNKQN